MKVLCPIDFSSVSVKAAGWISRFLNDVGGGEISFIHCMETQHRSSMFSHMDDVLKENAEADLNRLIKETRKLAPDVEFNYHIVRAEPKEYIVSYARHYHFDWIVTGTKGLTALKDVTVGSVTEYCIMESGKPVLTIPDNIDYKSVKTIVLGIDNKLIEHEEILKPLFSICNVFDAQIKMVHIKQSDNDVLKHDPKYEEFFKDINYEIDSIEKDGTISETLSKYAEACNAELLCMIHHKTNWFQELFRRSITKSELFDIDRPLLILTD